MRENQASWRQHSLAATGFEPDAKPRKDVLLQQSLRVRAQRLAPAAKSRFEKAMIVCILLNCIQLACNNPHWTDEPLWYSVADAIFCAIFTVEASAVQFFVLSLLTVHRSSFPARMTRSPPH